MSYQPIENYGIIGNSRTVALVSMNGLIDWYCYPQFHSPSIFGAILHKCLHLQIAYGRLCLCPTALGSVPPVRPLSNSRKHSRALRYP
jgi:GH15 family glucan-1,4-alpha-glucosidase